MTYFSPALSAFSIGLIFTFCGCGTPRGLADADLLQRMDLALRQATPSLQVRLQLSASQVKTGELVNARLTSNTAGFAYLLQLDTDGRALSLVFPNAFDGSNYMQVGQLDLPRAGWRMPARGPVGQGYLMAVVTPTPLDLPGLQAQLARGKFDLVGPYGAAMSPLLEIAP